MQFIEMIIENSMIISILVIILTITWIKLKQHRWHYFPLYLMVIIYFMILFLNYLDLFLLSENTAKWIIIINLTLLVSFIFFIIAFPTKKLIKPTGNFLVGTSSYELVDKFRHESYDNVKKSLRKIKYQVWYPTDKSSGYKKAKWISSGKLLTRQLASSMHLPFFMLDHTAEIDSNSYLLAPISNQQTKYPVVVISHGWKGFREIHTDFAEELASHGFIAISIDHTYGSQAVKFNDNRVALLNNKALPRLVKPKTFSEAAVKLALTYSKDIKLVLDDLHNLNNKKEFKHKLDLDAIGLLGHSTGGGAGVYTAIQDSRVKAVIGLDAWLNPLSSNGLEKGLKMPALFLRSEKWSKGSNNKSLYTVLRNSLDATLIQLDKTKHVDFSMAYMYSPLTKYIGFTGKLGGLKASKIQKEFILNFFNDNLKESIKLDDSYLKEIVNKYEAARIIREN